MGEHIGVDAPMKRILFVFCCLLSAGMLVGCQDNHARTPETLVSEEGKTVYLPDNHTVLPAGVKFVQDVPYGAGGTTTLYLDLLCPIELPENPMPAIVCIHGGGGVSGSKSDSYGILPELALEGYFCVTIDYRLAPSAVFPAQIEDCKCAVRYLRTMKDVYFIDPDKIGVWGASTGGYLASLLGTTGNIGELEGSDGWGDFASNVQAVVDWFGRTDLTGEELPENHSASVTLGSRPQDNAELARRASPVTYASADDPPFLIMHGDQDTQVPLFHSQALYAALSENGVDATLQIIEGSGHGFENVEDCYPYVRAFFDKHLK